MSETLSCWSCGETLDQVLLPVSRHEYCPRCAEAVHCCRMCVHYSVDVADQCREDRAEPPTDRTSANFCDFFSPRTGSAGISDGGRQAAARSELEALFGGPAADDDENETSGS